MTTASLENFKHIAGTHCSSSSIQDVLRYDGQEFSEAMIFGLGAGLGFFYFDNVRFSPTLRFNGRADDLEGKFYRLQGAPLDWHGGWKPDAILQSLQSGRPLLAQTDLYYLPYYTDPDADREFQQVHFPLHGVVVTAMDAALRTVTLADTFSAELQTISIDSLHAAIEGVGAPLIRPFCIAEVPFVELSITEDQLAQAIRVAVEDMLNPTRPELGIAAMRKLAADLRQWRDRADWRFAARFAYQGIDKRGSGGGSFRLIYADFLREASRWIPALKASEAEARMREAGTLWSAMAQHCKTAFVESRPEVLADASQIVARIARLEEELLRDLSDVVRPLL